MRRSRAALAAVVGSVLLYLSWQAFRWIPLDQELAGAVLFAPVLLAAVYACWSAGQRATASRRLRRAWRLIALALVAQSAGAVTQVVYEYVLHDPAYPTLADPLYLAFYPLMLAGIVSFPAARQHGRAAMELALDCAIVALGGGAVFVFFILGPDTLASSTPLEAVLAIAYPLGDAILLLGLSAALLPQPLPDVRASLRLMIVALGLFVAADLVYGYVVLHGTYHGGDPLDTLYIGAFACFALAAINQRAVTVRDAARMARPRRQVTWVSLPPYVAVAVCLGTVIATEYDDDIWPDIAVAAIAALVTTLVVARLLLSLASARQSQARLTDAQELAHIGSWDWDFHHDRVQCSEEELRLFGKDPAAPVTSLRSMLAATHADDRERAREAFDSAAATGTPFLQETRIRHADGEIRTLLARGQVETDGTRVVRVHGTHQDITDRKRMEQRLSYQAEHDPVTGLYNRARFGREVDRVLSYASHYRRAGALLILDVDNLERINEMHGRGAGDASLKSLSETVVRATRETDVVGRVGSDELGVALPEASRADAVAIAETVRRGLAEARLEPPFQVSVGIAVFDRGRELVTDDLLTAAETAMYAAKQDGKHGIRVFDNTMAGPLTWVERIGDALANDRFVLFAQPIIELATGRVSYDELLIRMLSPDGNLISPDAFLPTAERFELVNGIDRWVTGKGLGLARNGQPVSINLSAHSIGDEQILAAARKAIADGLAPSNVIFEITETAAMTNMDGARDFAAALTDLGCDVALDDFGTGFGSFTYLKHLPARYVKIDMEFVRDIVSNNTDQQVVKSITDVAHSLGKQTIAEGVQDQASLDLLRDYNVDHAQGFFIGRPKRISAPADSTPQGNGQHYAKSAITDLRRMDAARSRRAHVRT
jgi:diguanylate cyclase (GGDEF)-like protein/PAS domain S-box-containing protein